MRVRPLNVLRFTPDEAREKLNHHVRSLVEFAGIPAGTTGRVVDLHEITPEEFDVVIQWDLVFENEALRDRFAKNTYTALLSEEEALVAA